MQRLPNSATRASDRSTLKGFTIKATEYQRISRGAKATLAGQRTACFYNSCRIDSRETAWQFGGRRFCVLRAANPVELRSYARCLAQRTAGGELRSAPSCNSGDSTILPNRGVVNLQGRDRPGTVEFLPRRGVPDARQKLIEKYGGEFKISDTQERTSKPGSRKRNYGGISPTSTRKRRRSRGSAKTTRQNKS